MDTIISLLNGAKAVILPILLAFIGGGGIVAYFAYKGSQPESIAKAREINVTAEVTLGEGWKAYADQQLKDKKDLEDKFNRLQDSFNHIGEQFITLQNEHKDLKKELDLVKKENIRLTDESLLKNERIRTLEKQVSDLQDELKKYQNNNTQKVAEASDHLHEKVDEEMNKLTP